MISLKIISNESELCNLWRYRVYLHIYVYVYIYEIDACLRHITISLKYTYKREKWWSSLLNVHDCWCRSSGEVSITSFQQPNNNNYSNNSIDNNNNGNNKGFSYILPNRNNNNTLSNTAPAYQNGKKVILSQKWLLLFYKTNMSNYWLDY